MSTKNLQDPVQPHVTFDSYVLPETVQYHTAQTTGLTVNGTILAVASIGTLTFVLGILVALQLAGPQQVETVAKVSSETQQAKPVSVTEGTDDQTVTRLRPADLLTPVSGGQSASEDIETLQAAVLKGLQPKRTVGKLTEQELAEKAREAQAIVNRNKLRMLREGVMAGVYTVKARDDGNGKRLVLETINAEMTRQSMGNLLLEAARKGELEIPASLNTADGNVDLDTLLFNLIQTSLAEDGTPEGAEAAREMSRRAFAASDAKTQQVKGDRIYTVEPGDSLAYISLQFYGRPNAYLRIFEANREILRSPDLIKIGQRLIIPKA